MASRGAGESDRPVHLSVGSTRDAPRRDDPGGGEVLATPAPRRRWGRIVGLLVLGFMVGWVGGFDRGYQAAATDETGGPRTAGPVVTAPGRAAGAGLQATGQLCATQVGDRLWLGVELANNDVARLVVRRVRVTLPLGGLEETSLLLGTCGQLDTVDAETDAGRDPDAALDAGESTWVSGIFDVFEGCPAPYPVQFLVDYTDPAGDDYAVAAGSFPDLGDVEYSGC